MLALLLNAYTMGAGTYTGIEAVSNSMPVMREPRVATAKRTMTYMAFSLAITAGGLMIAYLLLDVRTSDDSHDEPDPVPSGSSPIWGLAKGFRVDASCGSRSWPRPCCCSSPPRPASSTGRACWPTWPTTRGCRTGSPTFPSGWPRTTA